MKLRRRQLVALAPAAVLAAHAGAARAAEASNFSEAEKLLFTTDHFKQLAGAAKLDYAYTRRGSLEAEFADKVLVDVGAKKAGAGRPVRVEFLSGSQKMQLPDLQEAEGNPVILYFLEREVREMNRITGGSQNYYRKRIRLTLANDAAVSPVTVKVGGKDVAARTIAIAPYKDDPARSRYEKFAGKTFLFTLSDQVPGGVVEMRSELLGEGGAAGAPVVAESIKYVGRR